MFSNGLALLVWVFSVHLAGIYLFTRGFLLTRLSLIELNEIQSRFAQTHQRAVILIIDALRFDFLSADPPNPSSTFHHNVLTLPRQLTAVHPHNSFLFNAYADPPTTTLQRIKGLTTGSLPTFVDLGNNFGGSSIADDSLVKQLRLAGKKIAFMGDDTWMSVFPGSFQPNMSFPYDSFNVEDLHTVDEGVIRHLFPLLQDKTQPFDFLIGHFLGVDHVGHRVGPDHPSMKAKLEQMNETLTRVVQLLEDDTLLVVLGDHGMDKSGDHGGDGDLETSSGVWIYSKGQPILHTPHSIPSIFLQNTVFPDSSVPHRSIQQIDLVPTISLLLGIPIPFNNLGTIIPELFWRDHKGTPLDYALESNALQIKTYLDTYRASPAGGELDEAWPNLKSAWSATEAVEATMDEHLSRLYDYNRLALATCRSLWAQFNAVLMGLGLIVLVLSALATWTVYASLADTNSNWEDWLDVNLPRCVRGLAVGATAGVLGYTALQSYLPGIDALDCVLFSSPVASCIAFIFFGRKKLIASTSWFQSIPIPLILHTFVFLSNSFTFWEDRIVSFLILSSIVPFVLTGFAAPTSRLRSRILGFSLLFAVCVRLISISTVCREEQQPYCHVTFFATSSLPTPRLPVLILAIPTSIGLPWAIGRFLSISKSDKGVVCLFLTWFLRPALVAGAIYWMIEWIEMIDVFGKEWSAIFRSARTAIARFSMGMMISGIWQWWRDPECLDWAVATGEGGEKKVTVTIPANAFGSPYLVFWSVFFSIVYTVTLLAGQLVLGLALVALLAYLEVVDSVRDAKRFQNAFASSTPSAILSLNAGSDAPRERVLAFGEVVPLALLGLHIFFGTGHQSVISTIQWKSAFVLTPTVTYPLSPMTVILNSFGPQILVGLAVPLVALWNRAPVTPSAPPQTSSDPRDAKSAVQIKYTLGSLDAHIRGDVLLAALGMMLYYECLLLGTAVSAAVLRRHLMVWKVFAPRFMCAVVGVLVVDVAVLIGVGVGVKRVGWQIRKIFGE